MNRALVWFMVIENWPPLMECWRSRAAACVGARLTPIHTDTRRLCVGVCSVSRLYPPPVYRL